MREPQPIIILGALGNCLDILDAIQAINQSAGRPRYRCLGFLDDDPERRGTCVSGLPVLGGLDSAVGQPSEVRFINGIGSPASFRRKAALISRTLMAPERFETLVHPRAVVSPDARLGRGVALLANVVVCTGARIGDHVIVLPNSVVGHDSTIGDYGCLAAGVTMSGRVRIGESCYLGANCSLREEVTVGANCMVGMGAVVIEDVPAHAVVVGNPARPLQGPGGRLA